MFLLACFAFWDGALLLILPACAALVRVERWLPAAGRWLPVR